MSENETKKSGFATASLVLGIIGLCTSFIPIVNNLSFILALIAIVFGFVAMIKKASKGMAIAGIIISILAMVATINAQKSLSDSLNTAVNEFNDSMAVMTGSKTDEILEKYLDVTLGQFEVTKGSYGITNTELPVSIKNKGTESKSFNIQIEAVDENGTRLATDNIYANNLGTGQTQNFEAFQYVESDKLEAVRNATFKIVEVSMY